MLDLTKFEGYTPGPWRARHDGKCSCKQVWSKTADHPVAKVESGEWGDEYPAIQVTSQLGGEFKVRKEMLVYGEINKETAEINARLIAAAPDLLAEVEALRVENKRLKAELKQATGLLKGE